MDKTCTGPDTSNAVNNALDKAEIVRILGTILEDVNIDENLDVYHGLGELISAIESGDFDLSTEALVSALVMRADVEAGLEVAADCEGIGTVYANPNDGIRIRVAVGAHRFRPFWNAIRSGDLVPMEASK